MSVLKTQMVALKSAPIQNEVILVPVILATFWPVIGVGVWVSN